MRLSFHLVDLLTAAVLLNQANGFLLPESSGKTVSFATSRSTHRHLSKHDDSDNGFSPQKAVQSSLFALGLTMASWMPLPASMPQPAALAADSSAIVSCLFSKCQLPLAKCIANPKCLANVICINTCNGKDDETGCQIKCGDLFGNDVVGEFNKCAVSAMMCVPQKQDDGSYPVPPPENIVQQFDTSLFNGRWYITAGQNPLFDTFPCQVHFFEETEKGRFFGKLNWRIEEPDGEFLTRDAVQAFVQDKKQPGLLLNHDNEFLHYQDDWYIIDCEYDNNKDGIPPFAFVYYRGTNDAWDGYGGVVIYTREASLPTSLLPRLREAAKKVNMDFDKDFTLTDNSCPVDYSDEEKTLLRERFAGDVVLQTERQFQTEATKLRGFATNAIGEETDVVSKKTKRVTKRLEDAVVAFEKEAIKDAGAVEKVAKDVVLLEKEVEKDIVGLEKKVEKDAIGLEKEVGKDLKNLVRSQ